jgi:hypothetical protein
MTLSLNVRTADSASLHGFSRLVAGSSGKTAWLCFYTKDYSGVETEELSVFMPLRLADMIVEAFHEYEDWLSGQECPTFDEALGAKCDAEARAMAGAK